MSFRIALADNEAVERRCQMLETKAPLDAEAVDAAIAGIRRPEVIRERLGAALLYSQRVEAEVTQLPISTALPHDAEEYMGRFLRVWTPDEAGHGQAQERLLDALGLDVHEAITNDWIASHLAWLLGKVSAGLYESFVMMYHTVGAMNEKLAMTAYQAMGDIAVEVGELELAEALFMPMRRDESMHLGYYRTYARELSRELRPWQLNLSRWVVVRTYAPVGARRAKHKATLGRTLSALGEDQDRPEIVVWTEAIAQELLAEGGPPLPPFAQRAMRLCVEAARAEDAQAGPVPVAPDALEAPDVAARG